uniref:Uncharacterized protein n=1 Tax=Mycena chlorophos TaxID=658473 RepID=A0ABQ0MB31_MYCCL|nr:predicted protein [Mycena chlorophos]
MPRDEPDSDTGERDVPSAKNFLRYEPITRTIVVPLSYKALNRRGRAIARIMASHDWHNTEIAHVFGVSDRTIRRVLLSLGEDKAVNDYDYAGVDFLRAYPPQGRYKLIVSSTKRRDRSTAEAVSSSGETSFMRAKRPRLLDPKPIRGTSPSSELAHFLADSLALSEVLDLSPTKLSTLANRGFTPDSLRAMADWPERELRHALRQLLPPEHAPQEQGSWDWFETSVLEVRLRRLRARVVQAKK